MPALPFEFELALRYLRPKRTFVSVITLISIIGVMLGVAVLITVISVMTGFDRELRSKILGFNPHLTVNNYDGRDMTRHAELTALISSNQHVRAVAPYILQQVFVQTQPEQGEPSYAAQYLRGINPKLEEKMTILPQKIVRGAFDLRGNRVLIGQTFARNLGLRVGDHIVLLSPRDLHDLNEARKDADADALVPDDYEIAGIFDVGHYEYNSAFIIASLATAQELNSMGAKVDGVQVMIDEPYQAAAVRDEINAATGGVLFISTWLEENSTFLDALVVEKNLMFYILFVVMIVAAFGIMSAQITFVVQKTREIGMLKALGASKFQIMLVFLSQSLMVGVFGVLTGLALGMAMVSYRNVVLVALRKAFGFELFPAKLYLFNELPAMIVPQDVAIICGASLVICILAGLFPAINASRLHPVEALRHE